MKMNKKQTLLLAKIEEARFIFNISDYTKKESYNFNWGYMSALEVAASIMGIDGSEIDAAKYRGESRALLGKG